MSQDLIGLGQIGVRVVESGEKFLARLIGPWLDEKGQELAESIRIRRRRNLLTVAGQTADLVGDQPIYEAPDRTLLPLLEAASNENCPDLQARWAALLANALTAETDLTVLPSFSDILKHLTPVHVTVLDWIYQTSRGTQFLPPNGPTVSTVTHVSEDDIVKALKLNGRDYTLIAADLHRLQLLAPMHNVNPLGPNSAIPFPPFYIFVIITTLGTSFIEACTPPSPK